MISSYKRGNPNRSFKIGGPKERNSTLEKESGQNSNPFPDWWRSLNQEIGNYFTT